MFINCENKAVPKFYWNESLPVHIQATEKQALHLINKHESNHQAHDKINRTNLTFKLTYNLEKIAILIPFFGFVDVGISPRGQHIHAALLWLGKF